MAVKLNNQIYPFYLVDPRLWLLLGATGTASATFCGGVIFCPIFHISDTVFHEVARGVSSAFWVD